MHNIRFIRGIWPSLYSLIKHSITLDKTQIVCAEKKLGENKTNIKRLSKKHETAFMEKASKII